MYRIFVKALDISTRYLFKSLILFRKTLPHAGKKQNLQSQDLKKFVPWKLVNYKVVIICTKNFKLNEYKILKEPIHAYFAENQTGT